MLTRRLHILIDDRRHRRLQAEARARGVSVAALVREAIDSALSDSHERKKAAAKAILAAPPMTVPDEIHSLKLERNSIRARGEARWP